MHNNTNFFITSIYQGKKLKSIPIKMSKNKYKKLYVIWKNL